MDTSKYIKKCPRCGEDIEPERCATLGDKIMGGICAVSVGIFGAAFGGPLGGAGGLVARYELGKHRMMSISDDYEKKQKELDSKVLRSK